MLIERDDGEASMPSGIIIDVLCIKRSISSNIPRKLVECHDSLMVQWTVIGHIILVKGLSIFSQHDVSIIVELVTTLYQTGVKLKQKAMEVLETSLKRSPHLDKWFVDIESLPVSEQG